MYIHKYTYIYIDMCVGYSSKGGAVGGGAVDGGSIIS